MRRSWGVLGEVGRDLIIAVGIIITTCFGPICVGHLQVVTRLSDQFYRNAWGVLGEEGRDLIIAVGAIITTTCFGPICVGHLQVVTRLSDQLYRNAWRVLGEFWGRGRVEFSL